MDAFYNFVGPLLGLGAEPKDLTFIQISLRGIIVFIATLAMIRLGHKRSLARKTAFDAVLIVILASVLSRAINGSAAFFATLGGSVVIVVVHRLFAFIAYYSHWFGVLIKGTPELIIEDGDLILSAMRRNHVSKHDLEEDLRLEVRTEEIKTSATPTSNAAATSVSSRRKSSAVLDLDTIRESSAFDISRWAPATPQPCEGGSVVGSFLL